ncbi:hypothetical protein G7Z17_g10654 [Cylindrodendrum hubeiense]|uniref:DUF6536 domain-containing protein n=1 Tax=Cylindrodendrum hubeiense TaxID=595255 RepID=A0A9P5GZ37_9HYPO|nr:hypothetical protein G7Z17_g10654 [Cylindrodendrum hubeiense]
MQYESISLIGADDDKSALNPDNDPDRQPEKSSILSKGPSGWRFSIALSLLLSVLVFAINLSATIWAMKSTPADEINPYDASGVKVMYKGNCEQANSLNTGLHVMINALSSALLAASNYFPSSTYLRLSLS